MVMASRVCRITRRRHGDTAAIIVQNPAEDARRSAPTRFRNVALIGRSPTQPAALPTFDPAGAALVAADAVSPL